MRRLMILAPLVLAACAYQTVHFGLDLEGLEPGGTIRHEDRVRMVQLACDEASSTVRPETVSWAFEGVLVAGPRPGTFRTLGAGEGTVSAAFQAAGARVLRGRVRVTATPAPVRWTPAPEPTMTPVPVLTPPPPSPVPDGEELVRRAYELVELGDHLGALEALREIVDPAWLPKARALTAEWADAGVDQGLARARALLAAGERAQVRRMLERIAPFPQRAAQRQAARALAAGLGR